MPDSLIAFAYLNRGLAGKWRREVGVAWRRLADQRSLGAVPVSDEGTRTALRVSGEP